MYGIKRAKKNFCQGAFFSCMLLSGMIQAVPMLDVEIITTPSVQVRNGGLSLRLKNPPKNSHLASNTSGRLLLFEWGVCYV